MTQAIAGVTPHQTAERSVMVVWPSNSVYGLGRLLGRLYAIPLGFYIFRVGNLIVLATIPIAAILCLLKVAPFAGIRYRLTNRRIVVERGLKGIPERSIDLDRFNQIDIVVRPGQAWYHSGDLVFRLDNVETFRLMAVSRPETFRHTCLKSQMAYTGVEKAAKAGYVAKG